VRHSVCRAKRTPTNRTGLSARLLGHQDVVFISDAFLEMPRRGINPSMTLAAFLPPEAAQCLLDFITDDHLVFADSWRDLERLLRECVVKAMILDPAADGAMKVGTVVDLMRKFPSTPAVAYVSLSCHTMRAIFELSRHGLADAVSYTQHETPRRLAIVLDKTSASQRAHAVLESMYPSLRDLSPAVLRAVHDLFQRPYRYDTATDIALEARVSPKSLYRSFTAAHLASPKRFLTVAKLLRGYCYLRDSGHPMREAARSVGYEPAAFKRWCLTVLGPDAAARVTELDRAQMTSRLVQWLSEGSPVKSAERPVDRVRPPVTTWKNSSSC
jgi:AraC-like DNA-binding protein